MASYLRPRRGKKATAESQAIVLKRGEVFFECPTTGVGTGKGKIKVGDGSTTYATLPYFLENYNINASDSMISFTDTSTATAQSNNSTYLTNIAPTNSIVTIFTNLKQLLFNYNAYLTSLNNDLGGVRFGYSGDTYGYKKVGADTLYPFSTIHTQTYTYPSGSTGGTYDMGEKHSYRYVDATNVYTKGKADGKTTHTGTYTFAVNDTGGTKDMGVNHTYRYVNATNVYNKGKSDGGACTLMWTNSNIKTNFAPQTVSLNLTNYDAVIIAIKCEYYNCPDPETSNQGMYYYPYVYLKKGVGEKCVAAGYSTQGYTNYRNITVTDTGVYFGTAYFISGGTWYSQYTQSGIPWKIWGIRCPDLPAMTA